MDSEEKITIYLQQFDLFDESFFFLKYEQYKKKFYTALGENWRKYASMSFMRDGCYVSSEVVFDTGLQIWLELRS